MSRDEVAPPRSAYGVPSGRWCGLLAVMETSPEAPALGFQFVVETRGLEWVEKLRLSGGTSPTSGWH